LAAFAFVFANQFAIFPLFFFHQDGQADVVGIFANNLFQFPSVGVLQGVFAQVQDDAGAACGALDGFHFKVTGAAADPTHAFGGGCACTASFDSDLVGHNETRIEAHTKLPNELRIGFLITRQFAHKVLGAAFSDGAQVVNGFLGGHANAVVGNGQSLSLGVKRQTHFQVGLAFVQGIVVQSLEAQFVAGI